jgi:hypothetical protein
MGAVKDFFLSLVGKSEAHIAAQAGYDAAQEELDRKSLELDALLGEISEVEKAVTTKKHRLNETMSPGSLQHHLTDDQRAQLAAFGRKKMPSEQGT